MWSLPIVASPRMFVSLPAQRYVMRSITKNGRRLHVRRLRPRRGFHSASVSLAGVEKLSSLRGGESNSIKSPQERDTERLHTSPSNILTDLHGRHHNYLRISLTERCNLRCVYCMPEEGVQLTPSEQLLTDDEIFQLAELFVESGVSKIRLTGGEPSLRKSIEELTARLNSLRPKGLRTIAMTSNGLVLHRKLDQLVKNGLNALNISLDTLVEAKFETLARRQGFSHVMRSIETALRLGVTPLKINCVIMRGVNDDEIIDFVRWTKEEPIEVRFIEFMPFAGSNWNPSTSMSYTDMISVIKTKYPLVRLSDEDGNTSKTYGVPGWRGKVGFISSMSDHFCSTCNRLRLLADGSLKACLFGSSEVSLRDHLRAGASNASLRSIIKEAVQRKKPSHDGMLSINENKDLNRPMILIGG